MFGRLEALSHFHNEAPKTTGDEKADQAEGKTNEPSPMRDGSFDEL
jgi:hypothetical protein